MGIFINDKFLHFIINLNDNNVVSIWFLDNANYIYNIYGNNYVTYIYSI